MRASLLMIVWLVGLLGVAYARATVDPTLSVPVDGLGIVQVDPAGLTMPVAVVLVVVMAIRSLPRILGAWKPTLHIEHTHTLKDGEVERLSRRDFEELIAAALRERNG